MDLIIEFYKELDTLNLIIFWGIIIVIVLLLIFSFVLINKNKKLKRMVEQNNKYEEDLPIIKETAIPQINTEKYSERIITNSDNQQADVKVETVSELIESENIKEEIRFSNDEKITNVTNVKPPIEIPKQPYQRNVLREMDLSQTSPIGINRQISNETKKTEMVKDLEETLNNEEFNGDLKQEPSYKVEKNADYNQIKKELTDIEINTDRKTEIQEKNIVKSIHNENNISNVNAVTAQELLKQQSILNKNEINNGERYLEEVSRKLAEAEIPEEIERTNYELQQEEDAIISYKELMEKKDSIQTIDEEEAIISIEELMNKTNSKKEDIKEETKLYNISEEEANDNFIKELKQFRNDL